MGQAYLRLSTRRGQSPTPLRGVSSPLEKYRNIAPPVMKDSPTRTKWLSDKVVAYASVFFSLPRPVFRRWSTNKLTWIPCPYIQKYRVMWYNQNINLLKGHHTWQSQKCLNLNLQP